MADIVKKHRTKQIGAFDQKMFLMMITVIIIFTAEISTAFAQYTSSPASWRYPQGNSEGVRKVELRSGRQFFDSLKVKWTTPLISGHVQPLIGNIVANERIFSYFPFAPNEMAAVVGDRLVIIDGTGKTVSVTKLPDALNGVIGISALLDTSYHDPEFPFASPTLVMGLETIEAERSDSLAVAFIVGHNHTTGKVDILRRFSMNLKDNALYPNISASLKPVYARKEGEDFMLYATFNMAQPKIGNQFFVEPPFLRGLTQFHTSNAISTFPLPDIGDDRMSRVTLGPEVSFAQPSQTTRIQGKNLIMLPTYPTPGMTDIIPNDITSGGTAPDKSYIFSFDISNPYILEDFPLLDMSFITKGSRPRLRPLYINITDNPTNDSMFVLVLEEYDGRNGSNGKAAIHLFDIWGNQLTSPENINEPPYLPPSFAGSNNHYWSVAVGNVDGNESNQWMPHFPNNRGNEIVVTQSSKEFAFAGSKLFVLRYNSGPEIDKPSPPGEYLYALDTIASQRINGWVAAVNDFDGDLNDGKDEIFLVNGSEVIALRMRNYNSVEFRMGMPFDTVFTMNFPNQTISNLAIADLDGDGLNEMIVTTFDTTYVIGTPLLQTIALAEPRHYNAQQTDYCAGDTLTIKWNNITGTGRAHLFFVETRDGFPITMSADTIMTDIPNNDSNVEYHYAIDEKVLGKEGFFIVASASNPTRNYDTTTILRFHHPNAFIDGLSEVYYYSGSEFTLEGLAECADSVRFEISFDGEEWTEIGSTFVSSDNTFILTGFMPCLNIFNCSRPDSDSVVYGKVVAFRDDFLSIDSVMALNIRATPFPVKWETPTTACPTITFTWDPTLLDNPCDELIISISLPFSDSFTEIANVSSALGKYEWFIPTNIPDTVIVRFCCENSCIRTDTVIYNVKPQYIKIVAPNPVRSFETVEIIYTVPRETNATIRVFDQSNRIVAEIVNSLPRSPNINYCNQWDGKLPDGTPAANGMYYISLELSDGYREIYPLYIRK